MTGPSAAILNASKHFTEKFLFFTFCLLPLGRDVERVLQRSTHCRIVWSSMEVSCVYITPKRKTRNQITSTSSEEMSPEGKKLKHSYFPDSKNSDDEDQVMVALNLTEDVTKKLDLILERG